MVLTSSLIAGYFLQGPSASGRTQNRVSFCSISLVTLQTAHFLLSSLKTTLSLSDFKTTVSLRFPKQLHLSPGFTITVFCDFELHAPNSLLPSMCPIPPIFLFATNQDFSQARISNVCPLCFSAEISEKALLLLVSWNRRIQPSSSLFPRMY